MTNHAGFIVACSWQTMANASMPTNGAYQIMRKVFPNVNADGIEGVALCPAVVTLSMSARRGSGCA